MDGPVQTVTLPQWTHADLPPGEQAALIAAKMRMQYGGALPGGPAPRIAMYTGDVFQVFDNGDGRWGVALVTAAGPDGVIGTRFLPKHGVEHDSWPELSTQNIRVECGVVTLEGRVGGHDADLAALKTTVKRLENELAQARGEIKGLRCGLPPALATYHAEKTENPNPFVREGLEL